MQGDNYIMIRDARKDEVNSLAELMCDLGYNTTFESMVGRFENIHGHEDYKTLIAVVDDQISGMIGLTKNYYYERDGIYVRVVAIVTKSNSRQRGIGKKLMEAAENWAKEIGANTVMLNSGNREERKMAHQFYEKLGYQIKSYGFVKNL